jgi:hypothetical protein
MPKFMFVFERLYLKVALVGLNLILDHKCQISLDVLFCNFLALFFVNFCMCVILILWNKQFVNQFLLNVF